MGLMKYAGLIPLHQFELSETYSEITCLQVILIFLGMCHDVF